MYIWRQSWRQKTQSNAKTITVAKDGFVWKNTSSGELARKGPDSRVLVLLVPGSYSSPNTGAQPRPIWNKAHQDWQQDLKMAMGSVWPDLRARDATKTVDRVVRDSLVRGTKFSRICAEFGYFMVTIATLFIFCQCHSLSQQLDSPAQHPMLFMLLMLRNLTGSWGTDVGQYSQHNHKRKALRWAQKNLACQSVVFPFYRCARALAFGATRGILLWSDAWFLEHLNFVDLLHQHQKDLCG